MTSLHTLICRRDVELGLICLETVHRALGSGIELRVHDDGTLGEADWDIVRGRLGAARILARTESDGSVREMLSRHPACLAYRDAHPMGLKLFDLPASEGGTDFCYVDSDVMFLRRVTALFPIGVGSSIYLRAGEEGHGAPLLEMLFRWGIRLPVGFNAGLFRMPRARYDLDRIEWLLGRFRDACGRWREPGLFEQSAHAWLAGQGRSYHFDRAEFHSDRFGRPRLGRRTVAIHFLYHLKGVIPEMRDRAMAGLGAGCEVTPRVRRARTMNVLDAVALRVGRKALRLTTAEELVSGWDA